MTIGSASRAGQPATAQSAAMHPAARPRPVLTVLLFTLLGPLLGYALVMALVLLTGGGGGEQGAAVGWQVFAVFHPMLWLFAFVFGGLPALLTGCALVLLDRRYAGRLPRAPVAALVGAVSTTVYSQVLLAGREAPIFGSGAVGFALIGAAAALACAYVTRRWSYNTPLTPAPNKATNAS